MEKPHDLFLFRPGYSTGTLRQHDLVMAYQHALMMLGYRFSGGESLPSATYLQGPLIIGRPASLEDLPEKSRWVNFGDIAAEDVPKAPRVWSHDPVLHNRRLEAGLRSELVRFEYTPTFYAQKPVQKTTDLLVLGTPNARQLARLDELRASGLSPEVINPKDSQERALALAKAKVLLVINETEEPSAYFDPLGVYPGWSARVPVLVERFCSVGEYAALDQAVAFYSTDLVDQAKALLGDETARQNLARAAMSFVASSRTLHDTIKAVLAPPQ